MPATSFASLAPGLLAAAAAVALALPGSASAQMGAPQRNLSRYWQLPEEAVVPDGAPLDVRAQTFDLTSPARVFINSDGFLLPTSWPSATEARVWIDVDGAPVSSTSGIDWDGSVAPQPHAYNCVGGLTLLAGRHTVTLRAQGINGSVRLAAGANLSVFVNPAEHLIQRRTTAASAPVVTEFTGPQPTASRCSWGEIPKQTILSLDMPTGDLPVFVFGSSRIIRTANAGDSMIGLFHEPTSDRTETALQFRAQWSVQDLFPSAELSGSGFCQGVLHGTASPEYRPRFALVATRFPPSHQSSRKLGYQLGEGATLVALAGGLKVAGWAANTVGNVCHAVCIGSSTGLCNPLGTSVPVSNGRISIPAGHDGIVFIAAKLRMQGDPGDEASRVIAELRLNGQRVGSRAVQGIGGWLGGWDTAQSQRTLAVSYLTTGAAALPPGDHTVELVMRVEALSNPPLTERMSVWDDDPYLVWFD
jgi:hypothetical protein